MKAFIYKPDSIAQFIDVGSSATDLATLTSMLDDGNTVVIYEESECTPYTTLSNSLGIRVRSNTIQFFFPDYIQLASSSTTDRVVFFQHGFKVINADGSVASSNMNPNSDYGVELVSFDFKDKACFLGSVDSQNEAMVAALYYKNLVGIWVGWGGYVEHLASGSTPSLNYTADIIRWKQIPNSDIVQDAVIQTERTTSRQVLLATPNQTLSYGLEDWVRQYRYNGYTVSVNINASSEIMDHFSINLEGKYVAR